MKSENRIFFAKCCYWYWCLFLLANLLHLKCSILCCIF